MNNRKWFDLTTSMQWTGGVVGIVRAELEIAAALRKLDQDIAFSMLKDGAFVEIDPQDIPWVFSDSSVADEYLAKRTWGQQAVAKNAAAPRPEQKVGHYLTELSHAMPSRGRRLQHAFVLAAEDTPAVLRPVVNVLAWLPKKSHWRRDKAASD